MQLAFGAGHEFRDRRQGSFVTSHGGYSAAKEFTARVIERDDLDLGSPQVDTDPHAASYLIGRDRIPVARSRWEIGRPYKSA